MSNDNKIRCKKCNRVIGERDENGQPVFNNSHVLIPLVTFIYCKGDPVHPCNTANEIEPRSQ